LTTAPDGSPVALVFDDHALDDELRRAGLRMTRVLDERGAWVEARLYSSA
jgi:hypothetical protein